MDDGPPKKKNWTSLSLISVGIFSISVDYSSYGLISRVYNAINNLVTGMDPLALIFACQPRGLPIF